MIKEAIILAGGLGTRLRAVVSDLPKCMAPVAGNPFLYYVIEHFKLQGIGKFIFALGYKHEIVEDWLLATYPAAMLQFSLEKELLGTGGAIKLACSKSNEKNVLVLNGDTLFAVDLTQLSAFHQLCKADCTLALKPMEHFNRYGVVTLNKDHSIASFKEKQQYESGLINGGVFALNVAGFLNEDLPEKFSFEKDYLEAFYNKRKIFGLKQDEYFIDIGIPEDFEKAGRDLDHLA